MTEERKDMFNKSGLHQDRGVATKAEIKALESLREEPEPALTLEPENVARFRVDYEMQRWRERRIAYLEARLDVAQVGMRREVKKVFDPER